jgi:hypothetical protein
MLPAENLDFPSPRTHSLDHPIYLIGLPARLAHFRHDDIGIEPAVCPRRELERAGLVRNCFNPHEHVLFRVVEPVPRAARTDDALELHGVVRLGDN